MTGAPNELVLANVAAHRHVADRIGVDERSVRSDRVAGRTHRTGGPALFRRRNDGISAAARRLHDRVIGVDERLRAGDRERDRISADDLVARVGGERHGDQSV